MISPDWHRILAEHEAELISRKLYRHRNFITVRGLVEFLEAGSYVYLDEKVFLGWIQKRRTLCSLEYVNLKLWETKHFIIFLEGKGLCAPGLLSRMRNSPTLFSQLRSSHQYCFREVHLEESWRKILDSFEISLRGYAPLYIPHIFRAAGEFAALLQERGKVIPDEEAFFEWLDEKLLRYGIDVVVHLLARLDRFCQFLVERTLCPSNPVREWRNGQSGLVEALQLRREGRSPKYRSSQFQSFLSSEIRAFIDHKRSLGFKYGYVIILEHFDKYLRMHNVGELSEVNERHLLDFLGTLRHWKAATYEKGIGEFRQFFHFLERRGSFDSKRNPAACLPGIVRPPYIPYIFTIQEIVAVISYIREHSKCRSEFSREMLFTFFYLIYACGLRISEGIHLQVKDVNFAERTLYIYRTKFGKSRLIPFGYRALEYLTTYHSLRIERFGNPDEGAPFFVHSRGKPYSLRHLDEIFRQACERTEVGSHSNSKPRAHDLRHSFAVHRLYKWYQEGAEPQEKLILLSLYMGHVMTSDTQHYLHISEDLLRIAGRPIERSLDNWMRERGVFQFND